MSETTSLKLQAFKELEQTGWHEGAPDYDTLVGTFTQQAVDRLLDAAQVETGTRVLDVACGPGYAAGWAAARGASVVGVDFAPAMVDEARARFPHVEFRAGEAENLDVDDANFDAVICNFGLLHVAEPEKAMAEAHRVLRPGGRYAFTVWHGPDKGPSYFSLLFGTFQTHANMGVALPPAPLMFRFSDHNECRTTLTGVGFIDPEVTDIPVIWRPTEVDMVLAFVEKCAVRGRMLIELQTPEVRQRIYNALRDGARQFEQKGQLDIPWPAVLATARKP
jgi:ubiquinone/menaquinone biosynthesis C-methylase UbiE